MWHQNSVGKVGESCSQDLYRPPCGTPFCRILFFVQRLQGSQDTDLRGAAEEEAGRLSKHSQDAACNRQGSISLYGTCPLHRHDLQGLHPRSISGFFVVSYVEHLAEGLQVCYAETMRGKLPAHASSRP